MKNQNIKIIFVDIDWTILDHRNGKHKFDKKSIRGLKKAQKRGVKVFFCTARPFHSIDQIGAFKLIKPDGYVCCNGAMAVVNDKVIYKSIIPHDVLHKLCEVSISKNVVMECIQDFDRFLTIKENKYVEYVYESFYEDMPNVRDYKDKDVISILLFAPREMDDELKKEFPKHISYYRFHDFGVDVLYEPHEKAIGLNKVLDYLNIDKEDTISFGDDYGDISMFNATGISVALNNGKDEVKAVATYVTKDVWKHGVYYGLKHYKII